jgi:hypothetical protein
MAKRDPALTLLLSLSLPRLRPTGDEEEDRAHACSDDGVPPIRVLAVAGLGDLFPACLEGAFGGGGRDTVMEAG